MPARTKKKRTGLRPQTFKGLSKKRIEKKGGSGLRVMFDRENPTETVQFLEKPDDMREYTIHSFQEDGRWQFVPCAGKDDGCPLCDSDDEEQRKVSYRFAANVWNFGKNRVQILEGPKTLAGLIFYKYERSKSSFLKRVFDVTKFPTQPVTYNLERADEESPVATRGKKLLDKEQYLVGEMKSYYGDDLDLAAADLRDEDEDYDDDEDEELEDDEELSEEDEADEDEELDDDDEELEDDEDEDEEPADEDEDDELDDDEELEDDDEDEEPPPPPKKKRPAKKAPAKKATKRAPKRPAKRVAKKRTRR